VRTLVRIAVLGEVARPGFFAVPSDALLSDAITLAGGPTGNAEMRRLTLSRHGAPIQRDEELRRSIADGKTIEDLGITAGDELMIPRRHDGERTARIIGVLVGVPVGLLALSRM
jgi:protein involved in polysaccharide export with SLBB domain